MKRALLIIFAVLVCDQALKIWVKLTMKLQEEFSVGGDWFYLHFIENNGMAFGMEFAGDYGKVFLSLFRLLASAGIFYFLYLSVKKREHPLFIASIALIFSGAFGNILDSLFYGVLFSESTPYEVAEFLPEGGGYSGLLFGKVVDMFYFPLIEGFIPEWSPIWSGEYFIFFRPVFNIADAAITTGISIIFVFQKRFFKNTAKEDGVSVSLPD